MNIDGMFVLSSLPNASLMGRFHAEELDDGELPDDDGFAMTPEEQGQPDILFRLLLRAS